MATVIIIFNRIIGELEEIVLISLVSTKSSIFG